MSTSCGGWQKYSNMRGVCYVLTTIYAKLRTVHRFSRQVSNLFSSDCFLQFKATKSQMERTARILTRKKDAIQHKMVMFAWWRKTKRNILIKPSLRCSLKPIWRHLTTLVLHYLSFKKRNDIFHVLAQLFFNLHQC